VLTGMGWVAAPTSTCRWRSCSTDPATCTPTGRCRCTGHGASPGLLAPWSTRPPEPWQCGAGELSESVRTRPAVRVEPLVEFVGPGPSGAQRRAVPTVGHPGVGRPRSAATRIPIVISPYELSGPSPGPPRGPVEAPAALCEAAVLVNEGRPPGRRRRTSRRCSPQRLAAREP
jgi:hypothetical protein